MRRGVYRDPTTLCTVLAACALLALAGGCGGKVDKTAEDAAKAVTQTAERGPVTMTVRADPGVVTVAQKLTLTVEVTAAAGVDVTMPVVGDQLGSLHVRDTHAYPDVPVEAGRQWRSEYTLESYSVGEAEIPALTVKFVDRRDPNKPIESELSSPVVKVEVASLLKGEFDPAQYADIKGAVNLPRPPSWAWLWWLGGVVGGLVLLAVLVILLRRRARRPVVVPPVPAHEWAFVELSKLRDEKLVEADRVHEFYVRLTWIVRRYIEMRFEIMAAEQTTREFLDAARVHPALGGQYRELLTAFLTAGDMVKFALHVPASGESEQAFTAAEGFVRETSATQPAPSAGVAA